MAALRNCTFGLFLLAAACSQGGGNEAEFVNNAMNAYDGVTFGDDDRARHLDEKADELLSSARRADAATAASLRNEAAQDESAAGAIERQGQASGAEAEERIEQGAGLTDGE